jgi:rubredoxin
MAKEDTVAEIRNRKCPTCDAVNSPLAVVDGMQEYRCSSCGLVYYGPCGCDTVPDEPQVAVEEVEFLNNWDMATPRPEAVGAAKTTTYRGC